MKPVGLTGGIATGKTLVSEYFRQQGAVVLNGDDIARDVLRAGSPAMESLADTFGPEVKTGSGELNRVVMLKLLVADPVRMKTQLDILAPYILPQIDSQVAEARAVHVDALVFVEAPLLFEYGRRDRYGPVIVVAIPRSLQIRRLARRSGKSRDESARIVDLQIDIDEKKKRADYIIDNSGSREETRRQVSDIYREIIHSDYFTRSI